MDIGWSDISSSRIYGEGDREVALCITGGIDKITVNRLDPYTCLQFGVGNPSFSCNRYFAPSLYLIGSDIHDGVLAASRSCATTRTL